MKIQKSWLITLFCATALFIYAALKEEKSLGEMYKSGSIRFVPELTIDDTSMPEDAFFEGVSSIVCDNDGNIYICDYKANNIKKFNASGKHLKTIGRKGQGPGEFNMPFEIAVTDDRLIVWDLGNRRLCVLAPDGEFIKSVQIFRGEGRPQKMRPLPNGNIVIELEKIYYGEQDKPQDCLIEIFSPELEKIKTLYTQQVWRNKFMRIESMFTNIIQPFSPLVCWDVSLKGKIVIGYPSEYKIDLYDSEGGKISSFSHSYEPVKVTDKDKESFFSGITYSSEGTTTQTVPEPVVKNTEFPKSKPAFKQILVDSEGNILVWPYRKNREEESKYFDAFTSDGNFIGNVQIMGDASFPVRAIIQNGSFWLQKTDEEGLIKVVKYRVSE
jgi:hypothetical protein